MQEDDELNELITSTLMKALVEEEGLPRERVERAVKRFLESIEQERSKTGRSFRRGPNGSSGVGGQGR